MKTIPREIKAKDANITIHWSDGHVAEYESKALRLACRCAACVDEWTHEIVVRPEQIPNDIKPTHIAVVGSYALHFTWSDSHNTGIYSYDYLRDQCQCASCKQAAHA
jgi:DUF971 family protein